MLFAPILQETRAQYEQLEAETRRSTTRSKISSISDDKRARDEVARLQKDLRQMERNLQAESAHMQAQLKASQDSLQRAQDKTIHMQRRVDAIDKEKLELKIANQRLSKKLEKQGLFAEKKRLELEKESHELELSNLRRKTSKLEKRLSMSQQLLDSISSPPRSDIMSPDGIRSPRSPASVVSPIPETLSESRIRHQEQELAQLGEELRRLRKENERLRSEIAAGANQSLPNANPEAQLNTIPEVQDSGRVEELEKLLTEEKQRCVGLQAEVEAFQSRVAAGSEEAYVQELQHKYDKLQKAYEDKETQLRVQTKTWKATNDEIKRQMEELEIAKLKAELGEGEEGEEGEDTDTEESAEISGLRERLNSVHSELTAAQSTNEELQAEIEKRKQEEGTEVFGLRERLNSVQLEFSTFQSTNEELRAELEKQQQVCFLLFFSVFCFFLVFSLFYYCSISSVYLTVAFFLFALLFCFGVSFFLFFLQNNRGKAPTFPT